MGTLGEKNIYAYKTLIKLILTGTIATQSNELGTTSEPGVHTTVFISLMNQLFIC